MATIKAISSHASITNATNYILNPDKTDKNLIFCKDCTQKKAKQQMAMIKDLYQKKSGRTYKHFVLSFNEKENISPMQVKIFTEELIKRAELFNDFQVIGAVHTDTKNLHAHFIVNSVAFTDGHKFNQSKNDLQNLKNLSDTLCKEKGFTVTEKGKTFDGDLRVDTVSYNTNTYHTLIKAEQGKVKSWLWDMAVAISEVYDVASSKEEFIEELKKRKIKTKWQKNRKYITFENENGKKVRNKKLQQYFNFDLSKEGLINEFETKQRYQNAKINDRKSELARENSELERENSELERENRKFERIRFNFEREQKLKRKLRRRARDFERIERRQNETADRIARDEEADRESTGVSGERKRKSQGFEIEL